MAASERIKTLLASSFFHSGPKLFNALPKTIRDTTGCPVTKFKKKLGIFLQTLTDELLMHGYTAYYRAATNSDYSPEGGLPDWQQWWITTALRNTL